MEKPRGALYLSCGRRHAAVSWFFVGTNAACVLACAAWCAAHAAGVRPGAALLLSAFVAGILVTDLLTGLVHWATDTWLDEIIADRVGCIAREHHIYPQHILDYGLRDYLAYMCLPTTLIVAPVVALLTVVLPPSRPVYFAVLVTGQASLLMFLGTHYHRLGHARAKSRWVRLLQRAHLLITPQYHALHHRDEHVTHYCVFNGWMNPICDAIGFWRGLERVVHALTGAVPRRSEEEWQIRFREDPSFMLDPKPSLRRLRAERAAARSGGGSS